MKTLKKFNLILFGFILVLLTSCADYMSDTVVYTEVPTTTYVVYEYPRYYRVYRPNHYYRYYNYRNHNKRNHDPRIRPRDNKPNNHNPRRR